MEALEKAHAVRARMPKCGARSKSTGQPCRNPALENGRCKFHGGLTPRGAGWHKIKMPAKGEARGIEKFEAKLAAQKKRKQKRRQKLAMMTLEQRERHDQWQASHTPGAASGRAHRRQQLETKAMLDDLLAKVDARKAAEDLHRLGIETDGLGVFG